jgi:iron complex transport system permease protein
MSPARTRIAACVAALSAVLHAQSPAGRIVIAPAEVPAGAITARIGGPYLIWLVRQRA